MLHLKHGWPICLVFCSLTLRAQRSLPLPANTRAAYDMQTRSPDGRPGKNYWQNRANYKIQASFDPASRLLTGEVEIQYFNNSPDTLRQLLFKLYPNLYKKGSVRMMKIDPSDIGEGLRLESVRINGADSTPLQPVVDGTNMELPINPLLPKQSIFLNIKYSYTLNKGSHIRTGEVEPGADFVAYFFPRVAVYDDVDGWNRTPYTGPLEFYNDFCHFQVSITVPAGYMVWATGDFQNPREMLSERCFNRLQDAAKNDSVTTIIDSSDLARGGYLNEGYHTWKFEADNVTDFAFATSNHYVWKSSSLVVDSATGRRTRVDAVFNPKHASYFNVIGYARQTVQDMSFRFPRFPFPYPHETVFDGADQMEYPMMVNDNPLESRAEDIELTVHEIFHTMFPFYMGINETKYGWMDEGWATLGEWLISPMIDSAIQDDYGMRPYESQAGSEADLPVTSLSTQQNGISLFINNYPKPALGYLFVKDMLGEELFNKAMYFYVTQWAGHHPTPLDFFNAINTGSGRNLNWFWQRWFYDQGVPNLGITQVLRRGKEFAAVIECKGTKPVPVDLTAYFEDGSKAFFHRDVSCWETGNKAISVPFTSDKKLTRLVLGSLHVPDTDKKDNVYEMK